MNYGEYNPFKALADFMQDIFIQTLNKHAPDTVETIHRKQVVWKSVPLDKMEGCLATMTIRKTNDKDRLRLTFETEIPHSIDDGDELWRLLS
ncbi:hypothetical protein ACFL0D_01970 [Thermoproteota archaeon]